jgi:outer membrane protein assembly factor BamB
MNLKKLSFIIFLLLLSFSVIPSLFSQTGQKNCWQIFRSDKQLSGYSEIVLPSSMRLAATFRTNDEIKSSPVVCNGIIYTGSGDGNIYALSLAGKLKWKYEIGTAIEAPPLLYENLVITGSLDEKVYALDNKTGELKWKYATEGQIMGSANFFNTKGKEIILVGSYDYFLHAINPKTGEGIWKYESDNFINGAVAVYRDYAIFGGCDAHVHLIDITTGESYDKIELGTYIAGSGTVSGDMFYIGDYDGQFSAVELRNRSIEWRFKNPDQNASFIASPAIKGNKIVIGARDKNMYCFDKRDGKTLWTFGTQGKIDSSPVICGEKVLFASMDGWIYVISLKDGKEIWSFEIGSPVIGSPAVFDDGFTLGAQDGEVYIFRK